jgi:hypothetical protein
MGKWTEISTNMYWINQNNHYDYCEVRINKSSNKCNIHVKIISLEFTETRGPPSPCLLSLSKYKLLNNSFKNTFNKSWKFEFVTFCSNLVYWIQIGLVYYLHFSSTYYRVLGCYSQATSPPSTMSPWVANILSWESHALEPSPITNSLWKSWRLAKAHHLTCYKHDDTTPSPNMWTSIFNYELDTTMMWNLQLQIKYDHNSSNLRHK